VDDKLIPTGRIAGVSGTPFDFGDGLALGTRLRDRPEGFDHCFVVDGEEDELRHAALLRHPPSGRAMEVLTDQPGLQVYTGNFLDGTDATRGYPRHAGLCLETQLFPDAIHQPAFPDCILRPGETYRHHTKHRFFSEA
jgi:aldose 1-epimerase